MTVFVSGPQGCNMTRCKEVIHAKSYTRGTFITHTCKHKREREKERERERERERENNEGVHYPQRYLTILSILSCVYPIVPCVYTVLKCVNAILSCMNSIRRV